MKKPKPGERCPLCGRKVRTYTVSEKVLQTSSQNGKKSTGRPVNPQSKRQLAIQRAALKLLEAESKAVAESRKTTEQKAEEAREHLAELRTKQAEIEEQKRKNEEISKLF